MTQAIADYSKAIELDAKDTQAYNNRALAYYSKQEYDKAWGDVRKSQELGATVNSDLVSALKAYFKRFKEDE